ncbi:MAG: hypothetical protein R3C05_26900 [Pirellulaceae bacterium]
MSLAVLNQVYDETQRLAIAGSNLAAGDFRLQRLIEPLRQSALKAPVFGQVADAVARLIEAPSDDAAQALLDLGSLVTAILYTQGQTSIDGDWRDVQASKIHLPPMEIVASRLKPLMEALRSTGSGRMDVVRRALDDGHFNDLRVVPLAIHALDDTYSELADFIAQRVVPGYGQAVVPLLRERIDIHGRGGDARRLRILHQLDPSTARPFVLDAVANGSKETKLAAVGCLGDAADDVEALHALAAGRSTPLRRLALQRLATYSDEATIALLLKAIQSADAEVIAPAVAANPSPILLTQLHTMIKKPSTTC